MPRLLINSHAAPGFAAPEPSQAPVAFHRQLPGYAPTPLRSLPALARRLGIARVDVKDESARFGLPAYKVLGAAWATCRVLGRRFGIALEMAGSLERLRDRLTTAPGITLVTATDGNHGRGVARVARWLGVEGEIYVPAGTASARIEGIRSEGARVIEVAGTYDNAVARAAATAGGERLLIQDHGWPGYEEIPAWVAEGYETLFAEIDGAMADAGAQPHELVLVQIGVGTLASAVVRHYRRAGLVRRPVLIGVEPTGAACALESVAAGSPVMLEVGATASIMAGLNCGTPSSAAWPDLLHGVDAYLAVEDEAARVAMRLLAAEGIAAGESGAAGLAGLLELLEGAGGPVARATFGLGPRTRALLLITEGVTDPDAYAAIVPRSPLP